MPLENKILKVQLLQRLKKSKRITNNLSQRLRFLRRYLVILPVVVISTANTTHLLKNRLSTQLH